MASKGDKETIFKDPFVKRYPEGVATLIKKVNQDHFSEEWQVQFRPDAEIVTRRISRL